MTERYLEPEYGADQMAVYWAQEAGANWEVFPAFWNRQPDGSYDRGAGMRRNTQIAQRCDWAVAFWNGNSPGTADTIRKLTVLGKTVHILYPGRPAVMHTKRVPA